MVGPFPADLHRKTLEDLGSFLHHTSRSITEILHRYSSFTSSALQNGASPLLHCLSPPEEIPGARVSTPHAEPLSATTDEAAAQDVAPADAVKLKDFMEEILKISCDWCNKHKAICNAKDTVAIDSNLEQVSATFHEEKRHADLEDANRDDVGGCHNFAAEAPLSTLSASTRDENFSDQTSSGDEEEIQPEQRPSFQNEGSQPVRVSEAAGSSFAMPGRSTRRKYGISNWHSPISYTNMKAIEIFQPHVEVIASPDWLPEGWITEVKTRSSGSTAGTKDKYYIDPVSKHRFRSRIEVSRFLETGKAPNHRKRSNVHRKRSSVSRIRKRGFPSTSARPPIKKEISKQNSTPKPSFVASTDATSNGAMGNMFLPFRIGRSSESFMHESLASLPFDPFNYSVKKQNADRSGLAKGPQGSKESWFYTESDTLWEPVNWEEDYERSYSPLSFDSEPSTKRYHRKSFKQGSAKRQ